jgi:hypothetical protein
MIGTAKRRDGAICDLDGTPRHPAAPRFDVAVGMAVLLLALAGCGQTTSSAWVSPGKYEPYPCQSILNEIKTRSARQAELEQLMARANEGFGGSVVNVLAYRGEYRQNGDELNELAKTADGKQCKAQSPLSSERVVF